MDKKIHADAGRAVLPGLNMKVESANGEEVLPGKFVSLTTLRRIMGHLEDYALEIGFDSDLLDDTEALRNIIELPT